MSILFKSAWRSVSPTWESPSDLGFDFDYTDEQQDDDDTSADDSVSFVYLCYLHEQNGIAILFSSSLLVSDKILLDDAVNAKN